MGRLNHRNKETNDENIGRRTEGSKEGHSQEKN